MGGLINPLTNDLLKLLCLTDMHPSNHKESCSEWLMLDTEDTFLRPLTNFNPYSAEFLKLVTVA